MPLVKTRLDLALVVVATSGDATVVDATDAINRTPSPQTTSAITRFKCFTEQITKLMQPPRTPGATRCHSPW